MPTATVFLAFLLAPANFFVLLSCLIALSCAVTILPGTSRSTLGLPLTLHMQLRTPAALTAAILILLAVHEGGAHGFANALGATALCVIAGAFIAINGHLLASVIIGPPPARDDDDDHNSSSDHREDPTWHHIDLPEQPTYKIKASGVEAVHAAAQAPAWAAVSGILAATTDTGKHKQSLSQPRTSNRAAMPSTTSRAPSTATLRAPSALQRVAAPPPAAPPPPASSSSATAQPRPSKLAQPRPEPAVSQQGSLTCFFSNSNANDAAAAATAEGGSQAASPVTTTTIVNEPNTVNNPCKCVVIAEGSTPPSERAAAAEAAAAAAAAATAAAAIAASFATTVAGAAAAVELTPPPPPPSMPAPLEPLSSPAPLPSNSAQQAPLQAAPLKRSSHSNVQSSRPVGAAAAAMLAPALAGGAGRPDFCQ